MNVLLKTEKISLAGCAGNFVKMYAAFSSTCPNMVCGNLDTKESWATSIHRGAVPKSITRLV